MDKAFDSMVGKGKVLVGAAGNEGGTSLHLYSELRNDSTRTAVSFENAAKKTGIIDVWGSKNSSFEV